MADADGIAKLVELTKDIKITMFTTIERTGTSSAGRWRSN